jgi:phosphoglucomutase
MDEFNFWLNDDYFDQATKDELLKIKDNERNAFTRN